MSKFVIYTKNGERVFSFGQWFDSREEAHEVASRHSGDHVVEFADDVKTFPKWLNNMWGEQS